MTPGKLVVRAVLWLVLAFGGSVAGGFAVGFFGGVRTGFAASRGDPIPPMPSALAYALWGGLVLQAILLLAARWEARRSGDGDRGRGWAAGPIERPGLITGLAALQGCYILLLLGSVLLLLRRGGIEGLPRFDPAASSPGLALGVLQIALMVVLAPVAEELFFRGWLWTALRKSWRPVPTALVTSVLWLLVHWPEGWFRPVVLIPTAILLSLARHKGGSVRASLLLHVVNNAIAAGLIVLGRTGGP